MKFFREVEGLVPPCPMPTTPGHAVPLHLTFLTSQSDFTVDKGARQGCLQL